MNNLWQNYKKVLNNTFLLEEDPLDMTWEGKRNTTLTAKIYRCLLYTSDAADDC